MFFVALQATTTAAKSLEALVLGELFQGELYRGELSGIATTEAEGSTCCETQGVLFYRCLHGHVVQCLASYGKTGYQLIHVPGFTCVGSRIPEQLPLLL